MMGGNVFALFEVYMDAIERFFFDEAEGMFVFIVDVMGSFYQFHFYHSSVLICLKNACKIQDDINRTSYESIVSRYGADEKVAGQERVSQDFVGTFLIPENRCKS